MVIYGNTAEDLGEFNIDVGLDGSLTDTVSAVEGNLEDLPPAFHPTMPTIKELLSPLKILSQEVASVDIPLELRKFLHLVFNVLDSQNLGVTFDKVMNSLLSVALTSGKPCTFNKISDSVQPELDKLTSDHDAEQILAEAKVELLDLYKRLHSRDPSVESSEESLLLESDTDIPTSKELMDYVHQHFDFCNNSGYPYLPQVAGSGCFTKYTIVVKFS